MAQQRCESWRLAIEYEKRLRAELKSKGFYDPSVRHLRKSVREAYENALFEDYSFAQVWMHEGAAGAGVAELWSRESRPAALLQHGRRASS